MQDGVHLLCHPKFRLATRLPSISAAQHIVKFPPKGPWSFTMPQELKNWEGPPQGPLQSSLGRLIQRVFPRGVPRGSLGGT